MGAHLLNEARAFAHKGERDRARELYGTIISKFGAVHEQTARRELAELAKGRTEHSCRGPNAGLRVLHKTIKQDPVKRSPGSVSEAGFNGSVAFK
jgi:hypothetical protein